MKNSIPQLAIVLFAFTALTFLVSYTRPAADEPKQYMVLLGHTDIKDGRSKFEAEVNQKLSEGWHLQGGTSIGINCYTQAIAK
jgi:hypothetical protein